MKIIAKIVFWIFLVGTTGAYASFLPPNNLHQRPAAHGIVNITEQEYNAIIDKVTAVYAPIVQLFGATLTINKNWASNIANADANRIDTSWIVNTYGGLPRRPEVSRDGFVTIICHELGHHLAGFFYNNNTVTPVSWSAVEGQADYFATHVCLPKVWENDVAENQRARSTVIPRIKSKCDSIWKTTEKQNLCYRIVTAGGSLANLFAVLTMEPAPSFNTYDGTQVSVTKHGHPNPQCRLDTYFAGALCTIPFKDDEIPARELPEGQNSSAGERLSTQTTCHDVDGFLLGVRPHCWFKPTL